MTVEKWWQRPLVAFDVESTGTDVHTDRVVTASIVHLAPERRPRALTWLIDPGTAIPTQASDIHGWTTDRLRTTLNGAAATYTQNGITRRISRDHAFFTIAAQVALAMSQGIPLIAFNAAFDLSILEAECARHQVPTLAERLAPTGLTGVVDPYVLDKHFDRRKGPRKLVDQVAHYGVIVAGAHDASADALAAARIVGRQVERYTTLRSTSLGHLHRMQVEWRAKQMDGLRGYFDRMGRDHDGCCGEWPVHVECAPVQAVA